MKRTFLASVLSLSLAATSLTATTAPARADEDVLKVIAGLVVLGAIANQVKQNKENKHVHRPAPRSYDSVGNLSRKHQRRSPKRHYKVAPQRCVRETWTHRGTREVYGARCMQRHAQAQPPQKCLRQNKTNSGPRYFYAKRCLRNQGWRA